MSKDLVRISVGIEDVEDMIWDLDQAIAASQELEIASAAATVLQRLEIIATCDDLKWGGTLSSFAMEFALFRTLVTNTYAAVVCTSRCDDAHVYSWWAAPPAGLRTTYNLDTIRRNLRN